MENPDMFNAATKQQTFHDFLERMKHSAAADLVKSIKSFIANMEKSPVDPDKDSAAVQEFFNTSEIAFKAHPLWANATEEELESAGEGLEKYVMTKIFSRVYSPLASDAARDQELTDKVNALQQFVKPEHLDLAPSFHNEASWLLAQKELQKINTYRTPRDKLVCILNCCRVINNLLLNVSMAKSDRPPGADDFLPALIFVVIKANPPQLHSNLQYIQRYRHASRLVSEAAYFYTNLVSAESFIADISAQSLSMDESEFRVQMQAAGYTVPEPSSSSSPPRSRATDANPEIAKLEAGGASGVVEADKSGQLRRDYPYLYATAGDLRVEDVQKLLHDYKELVLKHVALCKGLEGKSPGALKIAAAVAAAAAPVTDSPEAAAAATGDMTELLENLQTAAAPAGGDSAKDEDQWEKVTEQVTSIL